MSNVEVVKKILATTLQLGDKADQLTESSGLLGSIPEFDSMAVVTILTSIEEQLGIIIEDDEVDADVFQTFGSLIDFVDSKGM